MTLQDRPNHCFFSYSGDDREMAWPWVHFLRNAGFEVWFDQTRMASGSAVLSELTRQIKSSRHFFLLLTPSAMVKPYVKHEVEIASEQATTVAGFSFIVGQTDTSLDPSETFPATSRWSWLPIPQGAPDLTSARRLLLSLTPPVPRAQRQPHIFVSYGWKEKEKPLTRSVCLPLIERGARLVGDAKDQEHFRENGPDRIARIMSGCGGHLMVLPKRRTPGKTIDEDYKYFIIEQGIGRSLGLTRRIFCEDLASLPVVLQQDAIEVNPDFIAAEAKDFYDDVEAGEPFAFFASGMKHHEDRNQAAKDLVEHVLGMECSLGKDYLGGNLHGNIVERISTANFVFADLASSATSTPGQKPLLSPNLNTCVEAGIAKGARRPLWVTALDPATFDPDVKDKTTQVPFMFRDAQVNWYVDDVDFLAKVHRIAYSTRRLILSSETLA